MEGLKRLFLALIGLFIVIGAVLLITYHYKANLPVPPPDKPPTDDVAPLQVGNLVLEANAVFWQNFMPIIPPEGPPFYVIIEITMRNYGSFPISGFTAIKTTVYFAATKNPLHTFQLEPVDAANNSIQPGEIRKLEFTNGRSTIFSPDLEEGTKLYTRILVHWASNQAEILTTPLAPVEFTY
ncbi:MAG: hypothetical protein ACE5R6_13395 [Candidatus Heimdallarchaeota archaeon]